MTASEERHDELRSEEDRVSARPLVLILAVTLAIVALSSGLVHVLLSAEERALRPSGRFPEVALPQPSEVSEVERTVLEPEPPRGAVRAQREQLERYEWVDRERGRASIPIGRAMELVVRGAEKERSK